MEVNVPFYFESVTVTKNRKRNLEYSHDNDFLSALLRMVLFEHEGENGNYINGKHIKNIAESGFGRHNCHFIDYIVKNGFDIDNYKTNNNEYDIGIDILIEQINLYSMDYVIEQEE